MDTFDEVKWNGNEWYGVRYWKHYKITKTFNGIDTYETTYDPPIIYLSKDDMELTDFLIKEANDHN